MDHQTSSSEPKSQRVQQGDDCTASSQDTNCVKDSSKSYNKHTTVMSGMQVTFYSSSGSNTEQINPSNNLSKKRGDIHPEQEVLQQEEGLPGRQLQQHTVDTNGQAHSPTNADILEALTGMRQSLKGDMANMTNKMDGLT